MLEVEKVYKTVDGKVFDNSSEALAHQQGLFKKWLASRPQIDIQKLIKDANSERQDEFYGTEQDLMIYMAEKAFEASYE